MASTDVTCTACNAKIDQTEPVVEAMTKKFHKKCFACVSCNQPISGSFHPGSEGKPWCSPCFLEKQALHCSECSKPITGTAMKTGDGRTFHSECAKNLSQGTCAACNSKIGYEDPIVQALGKIYHGDCFRCAQCKGEVQAKFHTVNGQPYCEGCYNKRL